jgi:multicomponent Na+:H+ antiporter subunit F|tara:strand:- start:2317 stop:2610 length:294 start_codon:yes stop_codon:yes gene_type:complete
VTLTITLIALLVTMAFALIRAIKGPTVYDRILASNALGTKTVLMITVLGFVVGDPELYIDIALMYVLIGFIGTVAVLKVSEFGNLGQPQSHTDPEDP